MLSIITYKDASDQIEIIGDEKGLQELIDYLTFVKDSKDHMHLISESEIDDYPVEDKKFGKTVSASHVLIEFNESDNWL